jgi:hypothetical protein
MRKVIVSILVSLDGSFEGPKNWIGMSGMLKWKLYGGFPEYRGHYLIGTYGISTSSKILAIIHGEPCSQIE